MDARNIQKMLRTLASRQRFPCRFFTKFTQHFSSHAGMAMGQPYFGWRDGLPNLCRGRSGQSWLGEWEGESQGSTLNQEERPEQFNWAKGGGWVHKLATIDASATVEIGAVIHEHVQVGPHSHIGSSSILGPHVIIGSHSKVWYNVSLQNTCIGDHCIIHCGVCIGQDGFGFFVNDQGEMVKKPQMLQVKIGDHVEIGANCCIDRGSWRNTVIGDHTKIDNQVQIGHNVVIGHSCMICGQVGLGGSSTVGDYVVLGGKAGVADHVCIASKVRIAAKSGVTRNITKPGDYAGFPVVRAAEWRKSMVRLCKLGQGS